MGESPAPARQWRVSLPLQPIILRKGGDCGGMLTQPLPLFPPRADITNRCPSCALCCSGGAHPLACWVGCVNSGCGSIERHHQGGARACDLPEGGPCPHDSLDAARRHRAIPHAICRMSCVGAAVFTWRILKIECLCQRARCFLSSLLTFPYLSLSLGPEAGACAGTVWV